MNPVFIAGCGLASALGPDLPSALAALRLGGVAPQRIEVSPGQSWPFHRIADDDPDWWSRAQRIVHRVASESGALQGGRRGPLFVASSSFDMGACEVDFAFAEYPAFAEAVARWLDWQGPVFTVATACTSGLNALMSAAAWLGQTPAAAATDPADALVVGIELRNRTSVAGFGAMQLLSPDGARPFGAARNGLVLGEAVGALRLSTRSARWRVCGAANLVDGSDPAGTVADAVMAMCRQALERSGLQPHDIDLIKPQAAGGVAGDATEARALHEVFGRLPALVSFKAAIGHTLGAAGVAEVALLLACLDDGKDGERGSSVAWPRIDAAPDLALAAPLAGARPPRVRHLLASILGFGGGHAAVVLQDGSA